MIENLVFCISKPGMTTEEVINSQMGLFILRSQFKRTGVVCLHSFYSKVVSFTCQMSMLTMALHVSVAVCSFLAGAGGRIQSRS